MLRQIFIAIAIIAISSNLLGQSDKKLNISWSEGLKAESDNGNTKIKIGGRIQTDLMIISQDDSLNNHFDANNGVEFRRARLYMSGSIYKNIKFKFQVDFAGSSTVIKDAYIQLTKIPVVGNLRVGNFKEPFGLSMLTSSKYITFMERPLGNAFDNDRNTGAMLFNQHLDKRLSWYAGYFFPTQNTGKYVGNKYNLVARLVGLPIYNVDNGYKVLHLGGSFAHQFHDNTEVKYSVRPEAHLAPKYLTVKVDQVADINDFNFEFLLIYNSLSFDAEYTTTTLTPSSGSTLKKTEYNAASYSASASWFVTGEHKNYDKSKTFFDKVKPRKNFGSDGGLGAIELALRYSNINLDDDDLSGGIMSNITAGANWYLNPATRVTLNYVYADVKNIGKANIFQMRFQIVF